MLIQDPATFHHRWAQAWPLGGIQSALMGNAPLSTICQKGPSYPGRPHAQQDQLIQVIHYLQATEPQKITLAVERLCLSLTTLQQKFHKFSAMVLFCKTLLACLAVKKKSLIRP
jgi:hypothetical protein